MTIILKKILGILAIVLITVALMAGTYFIGFKILLWVIAQIAHAIKSA